MNISKSIPFLKNFVKISHLFHLLIFQILVAQKTRISTRVKKYPSWKSNWVFGIAHRCSSNSSTLKSTQPCTSLYHTLAMLERQHKVEYISLSQQTPLQPCQHIAHMQKMWHISQSFFQISSTYSSDIGVSCNMKGFMSIVKRKITFLFICSFVPTEEVWIGWGR